MKRKRCVSDSGSDGEPQRKKLAVSTSSKIRELMKYKREKCEFCDNIFYNRYDILVHNAEHIMIPLTRDPLIKCPACSLYFSTKEDLTVHIKLHHKVPDLFKNLFNSPTVHYNCITEQSQSMAEPDKTNILRDFIDKEVVVRCDDSLRELMFENNEKILGNIANKKAIVECDDIVTELIMENNEKKLEKIIKQNAVVACDDTLTKLILGSKPDPNLKERIIPNNGKHLEDIVSKEAIVQCDNSVNELIMESNEKKLEKIIKQNAVVTCDDTLTKLIIGSKTDPNSKETPSNKKQLEDIVNKEAIVQCDNSVNELIMESNEKKLEKIIKQNAVVACDDTLTKLIIGSKVCKDLDKQVGYDDIIHIISDDEDNDSIKLVSNNESNNNKISSRIVFENDFEDDIIVFNHESKIIEMNNDDLKPDDDSKEEYIIPDEVPLLVEQVSWSPSVHYEELIEPEEQKCKICDMIFPDRYKLIVHKVAHIKMRVKPSKTLILCVECERYITGNYHNLRHHMQEKHPNATPRKKNYKNCDKCGLKYHDPVRHHFNYHSMYTCRMCLNHFFVETERDSHEKVCKNKKEPHFRAPPDIEVKRDMKVCEMCSLFFKYNTRMKYICTGDFSRPGARIPCEYCGKKFFEVKLYKMIPKLSKSQRQNKFCNNNRSNEERLKNIKKRLSLLNKS